MKELVDSDLLGFCSYIKIEFFLCILPITSKNHIMSHTDIIDELVLFDHIYYSKKSPPTYESTIDYDATRHSAHIHRTLYPYFPLDRRNNTNIINNYGNGNIENINQEKRKSEKKESEKKNDDVANKLTGTILLGSIVIGLTYYVASCSDYCLMYRSNIPDQLDQLENDATHIRMFGKKWINTYNIRTKKTFIGFVGAAVGCIGVGCNIFIGNTSDNSMYGCLAGTILSGCYMMYNSLTSNIMKEKREYDIFKLSLIEYESDQN